MQYLVIGQGVWGKGTSQATATASWRQMGGEAAQGGYRILRFEDDDAVQAIGIWGDVTYKGPEPTVVRDVAQKSNG